jgi:hypothetical protein
MYITSLLSKFQLRRNRQQFSRLPTSPLDEDEDKVVGENGRTRLGAFWSTASLFCAALGTAVLAGAVGYFAGQHSLHEIYHNGLLGRYQSFSARIEPY